ncbi:MAG: hypothetical protein HQL05_12390 [Nitrospirae bacterium]|uniref:hypothetical protein n=1 Tax=Candidatus Magnetobacterium casense TaxID=1455061 RepID=UPI00058DE057|nr:hypothetical protein [Candidatus Magnetobacterium casensis]MBF0338614.1 hypothetical protein [Nitrospirota bacterium]
MNRRLVIAVAVYFICIMADVCAPIPSFGVDGPYTGRIVELETGEPIERAVVAACWGLEYTNGWKTCCKETITDKSGEFEVPAAMCITTFIPSVLHSPRVVIFKPGYLGYPPIKTKKSLYTGVQFDKEHRHNVIKLDKAITLSERSETLHKATSLSFISSESKNEPKKVIFERELPHLFQLTKQEEEYLKKEWEQIRKEQEQIVVPVPPALTR